LLKLFDPLELLEVDAVVSVVMRNVAYQGIHLHALLEAHGLKLRSVYTCRVQRTSRGAYLLRGLAGVWFDSSLRIGKHLVDHSRLSLLYTVLNVGELFGSLGKSIEVIQTFCS
jgi:hypothetical protein